MRVYSTGINKGFIDDKYGKRGKDFEKDIPVLSFPFTITEEPEGTVSYALVLEDEDAIPVVGYSWIHWMAANITQKDIPENYSKTAQNIIQGENSWGVNGYGGMTPPDAPHRYDLHIYALDCLLDLKNGFNVADLYRAMGEHILDSFTLSARYNN